MERIGNAIQVLGVVVLFGGLFWIKGPAIVPIQYAYGFGAVGIGVALLFVGKWIKPSTEQETVKEYNE